MGRGGFSRVGLVGSSSRSLLVRRIEKGCDDGRSTMSVREDLERKLLDNPGLNRRRSRYGDAYSYFVGDREIAHFHGDGRMDVRLTHQRIREMKADGTLDRRVKTRGPSANWATLPLDEPRELVLALELIEEAIRANA